MKAAAKTTRDEILLGHIKEIREDRPENENYGVERIHIALKQVYGYTKSKRSVYRIMSKYGLLIKVKRKPNGITEADSEAQKSENLIKQDFTADAPNKKWLTDITEVPCIDGKLYVSPVFDCYSGEIVGLTMADNKRKELCAEAFEDACRNRNAYGMIFHSDRGSQYTSGKFRESLAKYGAIQSMSGTGRCYDNARMESFFATVKKEKLYKIKTEKLPMSTVKTIIFRYIMIYYNRYRIYTSNPDGLPPAVYRERYEKAAA